MHKKIILLTIEKNRSYQEQKVCYIAKKYLVLKIKIKNTIKSEIIVILLENIEVLIVYVT